MTPEERELLRRLRPWMVGNGVPVPAAVANTVPRVFAGLNIGKLAEQLAMHLRGSGLFRAGEEFVTVDEGTGMFQLMKPARFISWVSIWVKIWKAVGRGDNKDEVEVDLQRGRAEELLCSDVFRCKIPELRGINPVRLPVRRKGGKVELLEPGYDAESGIYTLHGGPEYDEEMNAQEARDFLLRLVRDFDFPDERSRSVHFAGMLTSFCTGMLPRGARMPMFVWNANQVSGGKTLLATMCLLPVFGTADLSTWWDRPEDFKKELDSAAQAFSPYLFFDDRKGLQASNLLNGWLTATRWAGRVMGGKERFSVPLRALTMITGNNLTYSDDLHRRALVCEIFMQEQFDLRKLPEDALPLGEEWLLEEGNRRKILSALWALVKHAEANEQFQVVTPSRLIPSFEGWSRTIPRILMHAAMGDPTERQKTAEVNPEQEEARQLVRLALDEKVQGRDHGVVTLQELVRIARVNGLWVSVLGSKEDVFKELDAGKGRWKDITEVETDTLGNESESRRPPTLKEKDEQALTWTDKKTITSFGSRLTKRVNGLRFRDSSNGLYEFGKREESRTSQFTVTRIKL